MWSFSVDKSNWQQSAEQLRGAWKLSNVCTSLCFSVLLLHMLLWCFHRVSRLTEQFHRVSGPKGGASRGGTKLCVAPAQQEIGSKVYECPREHFCIIDRSTTHHFKARHTDKKHCLVKCEWLSLWGSWELTTAIGQLNVSSVCHVHLCLIMNEMCQAIVTKLPPICEGDVLEEVVRWFQSQYNIPQSYWHYWW